MVKHEFANFSHNWTTLSMYVARDGGGCLYTVIQWKLPLESVNWANRTVQAKVRTIQKTMIPVLSRENAPARRKRP